jgi:hypothetical protein
MVSFQGLEALQLLTMTPQASKATNLKQILSWTQFILLHLSDSEIRLVLQILGMFYPSASDHPINR